MREDLISTIPEKSDFDLKNKSLDNAFYAIEKNTEKETVRFTWITRQKTDRREHNIYLQTEMVVAFSITNKSIVISKIRFKNDRIPYYRKIRLKDVDKVIVSHGRFFKEGNVCIIVGNERIVLDMKNEYLDTIKALILESKNELLI